MAEKEVKSVDVKVGKDGHATAKASVEHGDRKGTGTADSLEEAIAKAEEQARSTGGAK